MKALIEMGWMVEMLPSTEQNLAYEMIKRLVLAWDSDFTKLTPVERKRIEQSEADYDNGEFVSMESIDWN